MRDNLSISFEFFPPKTEKAEAVFWRHAKTLADLNPEFVSVTCGAGGSTREGTKRIVTTLQKDYGVNAAAHLTCVCATREEINAQAQDYWDSGISRIVALRGDPPEGVGEKYVPTPGGYAYADDLVKGLKNIADFDISVAGYPETHPQAQSPDADLDHLKRKVDAGANRVMTQFFMDPAVFLKFRDTLVKRKIDTELVAGILPITNFARTVEFSGKCGASVPDWLHEMFAGLDDQKDLRQLVAAAFVVEQCQTLYNEGVRAFHFYTLNRAPLTQAVCRMFKTLKERAK